MKFILLIYQGNTPLPGSDGWKALPEVEQKAIYADYAAITKAPGVTPGLPLGLPASAKTVQVRDGSRHGPGAARRSRRQDRLTTPVSSVRHRRPRRREPHPPSC
jgi:hypothetical protein